MKRYSKHAIDQLTRHILKDTSGFNWLMNNGYRELPAAFDAIRDEKGAFKYLMDNKYVVLAAFVNAIWEDEKAFKFLMDVKAFEWAATANLINGDEKAEAFLKRIDREHYVLLGHAIQSRIHEDGDRNTTPTGVLSNLLNFKKAFKKDEE